MNKIKRDRLEVIFDIGNHIIIYDFSCEPESKNEIIEILASNKIIKENINIKLTEDEIIYIYKVDLTEEQLRKRRKITHKIKRDILKFDDKSKLIWKKNYYSKSEKKLKPILPSFLSLKYLSIK